MDIQGIATCDACNTEVYNDLLMALLRNDFTEFEKKYYASNRKTD